jgi:hypothetical protein
MDWQPIGTEVQHLTPNQQRIKDMLDAGKSIWIICGIMRMRREHVIDEIYDIRRKESIMKSTPNKLTSQQRAAIYQSWKNGISQADLAKQYGVTPASICILIKKFDKLGGAVDGNPVDIAAMPERKAAAVNQDFENAIDKMIEDAKAEENAANAEKKSVFAEVSEPVQDPTPELEDVENGIPNTPLVSEKSISPVIRRLVTYGISDMESEIEEREQQIAELKMEIEEFRKDIEIAKAWKEQQKWK